MSNPAELHDNHNGTFDVEILLRARVQALHAAVNEASALIATRFTPGGLTTHEADRHRDRVLRRAEELEDWILRPAPER